MHIMTKQVKFKRSLIRSENDIILLSITYDIQPHGVDVTSIHCPVLLKAVKPDGSFMIQQAGFVLNGLSNDHNNQQHFLLRMSEVFSR